MATIAENLSRIQSAKTDIKTAIEAKGVTVPSSATIDTYASYVSQISGGGGSEDLTNLIQRTITSIDIPSGVTSIGDYAFQSCSRLSNVTIPSGVTSIGYGAFEGCSRLSNVTIPSGVTSLGAQVFQGCSRLSNVTIPSGVTSIGIGAFQGCTSLTSVTIPSGVTSLGYGTFQRCTSLTSVTIPSGVTSIGGSVFAYCNGLTSVTVEAITPPTLGSSVFKNTNCPIYVPAQSVQTYKSASGWSSYASRIQAIQT